MKLFKNAAAALLSAAMLFSGGTTVLAAQGQEIANNQYGEDGLGFAPDMTWQQADSGASLSPYDINCSHAGTAKKNVGETGILALCPIRSLTCGNCGNPLLTANPVVYAEASAEFSKSGIIETIDFTNVATSLDPDFPNAHSIQYNYRAVKPGKTTVTLTYYVNYYMTLGELNGTLCQRCYTGNKGRDFAYHKVTQQFDVEVAGDPVTETYTVTYTDGVEDDIVFPDQGYEGLFEGDKTPEFEGSTEREGYTFMGWAPAVSPIVQGDAVYTATWKKNETPSKVTLPGMDKKILNGEGQEVDHIHDFTRGETATFRLKSNVPTNLFDFMTNWTDTNGEITFDGEYELVFHDDLSDRWELTGNPSVTLAGKTVDAKYYTYGAQTEDGCDFHLGLDLMQMYRDGELSDDEIRAGVPVSVSYNAVLDEEAENGVHENKAWVAFPGKEIPGISNEDVVLTHIYGLELNKIDSENKTGLAGAEFELKDAEGNLIATLITDENGKASCSGLKPGTYKLVETKAPGGYIKSGAEIEVVIAAVADLEDDATLHVVTKELQNAKAPTTGGVGTAVFTMTGTGLMAAAAVMLVISRRKKEED